MSIGTIRVGIVVEVSGETYAVHTSLEPDWTTAGAQRITKVGEAIDEAARKVVAAVGAP